MQSSDAGPKHRYLNIDPNDIAFKCRMQAHREKSFQVKHLITHGHFSASYDRCSTPTGHKELHEVKSEHSRAEKQSSNENSLADFRVSDYFSK